MTFLACMRTNVDATSRFVFFDFVRYFNFVLIFLRYVVFNHARNSIGIRNPDYLDNAFEISIDSIRLISKLLCFDFFDFDCLL